MALTIQEGKAFIIAAQKDRENWLTVAERSWREIKKRQKNNRLWSLSPNSAKKKSRYPAWFSIFKIRQPLLLSRVGIPIGRDTTQDGIDNIGATAAICKERLAINLAKSFNFFDELAAARDDFLATDIGWIRAYYTRDEIKEHVKEYITPQKSEDGNDVVFIGADGKVIESDDISQDDQGYFIEHEETIDVDNEKVYLEHILYKDVYVDPGIRKWDRVKRLAVRHYYSPNEFKEIFGASAFAQLPQPDEDDGTSKLQSIAVIEYWDEYENEPYWWPELGNDFIKPLSFYIPDNEEALEENDPTRGLYNLEKFFPVPPPLIRNNPTDEFWPVPEFYQLQEIFEDIHTIFSRMIALTRAIRARLLFDNNIEGLQEALNEATEGDAFGVANLAQALSSAGGSLENVVQYIPVEKLINGLNQCYQALEQRLNTVYKLTGTSDLLQGFVTDTTDRTFGERQLQEKYALNQIADPQRKIQVFVRDCYELLCEMALKNFKDSSLDLYIMPQTLQPEHQERYRAALELLKQNQKRFRIELETDSTIALNEDYDKKTRVELVNTLTAALEKTAAIGQTNPSLVVTELHCLKYLVQGFRQGKLFQNEITQAIDQVIQQSQQQQPPPFNADEARVKLESEKLSLEAQRLELDREVESAKIQSNERIEIAKLQQEQMLADLQSRMDSFKAQSDSAISQAEQQIEVEKLKSDIAMAQQDLALKRDQLMVDLQKAGANSEIDRNNLVLKSQIAQYEKELAAAQLQLEQYKVSLDEKEKYSTEARLQAEHQLEVLRTQLELANRVNRMQQAPTVSAPVIAPQPRKKSIKVLRDELGNVKSYEVNVEDPTPPIVPSPIIGS